jgi:hypothetical protein
MRNSNIIITILESVIPYYVIIVIFKLKIR